ncbi:MAG: MFS transporter [Bacilli bacterium]
MEHIRTQRVRLSSVNLFWFSLSFQSSVLMTIVVPAALLQIADVQHTMLLAHLATEGALIAMILPPLAGMWSDRMKARGRGRRPLILFGAGFNALGLMVMFAANDLRFLIVGFFLVLVGQSAATVGYEALWSDVIPKTERGKSSGYRGVSALLGTIAGLATSGIAGPHAVIQPILFAIVAGAVITVLLVNEGTATPEEAADERPQPIIRNYRDFHSVFAARSLVAFAMTLLMTFVLYFLQDVLHVSNPSQGTAFVAALSLVGAVVTSVWMGRVADRMKKRNLVALSALPMALAAGGFAFVQQEQFILLFAIFFGLGYGAFVSTDWALAIDSIPDPDRIARDLGVWGIASSLPSVLAPAVGGYLLSRFALPTVGYRVLFLLAAASFLLSAAVVMRVDTLPRSPLWAVPLRLLIASVVWLYLRFAYHIEFVGRLPLRRGATLIVSNHQHDLDGMVAPAWFTLAGPWRHPVYYVASQRMFEPGFLATRLPKILHPLLYRVNAAGFFRVLGVLPIENQPLMRPISSFGYAVRKTQGNLALDEVFTPEALRDFDLKPKESLGALWKGRYATDTLIRRVSLTALREPYRTMVRTAQRAEIEKQMYNLKERLREGGTLYLTPEGRYSLSGRVQRLRLAFAELRPLADRVYGMTINYDPFLRNQLSLYVRLEHFDSEMTASSWLASQRVVTVSQVVAAALLSLPDVFSEQDVCAEVERRVQTFPASVFVAAELVQGDRPVKQCLQGMIRKGVLQREHAPRSLSSNLTCGTTRELTDFPGVTDILMFLQHSLEETLEACRDKLEPMQAPAKGELKGSDRPISPQG